MEPLGDLRETSSQGGLGPQLSVSQEVVRGPGDRVTRSACYKCR